MSDLRDDRVDPRGEVLMVAPGSVQTGRVVPHVDQRVTPGLKIGSVSGAGPRAYPHNHPADAHAA